MSSLLERAIVDAKALKESALKNAENLVIEKYSQEVRDAMQKLLEQDMDDLPTSLGTDDLDFGMGDDADTLAAATDVDLTAEDPATDDEAAAREFADSTVADIPDAFDPDLGDPGDEIISIKLDSLRAEIPEEEDGPFGGDEDLEDEELSIDITDDEEVEDSDEDFDLDLDSDLDLDADPGASMDSVDLDTSFTPEMVAEALSELDINSDDIDIDELMERVRVDFEPQKSGWAGTPEPIMREYESMLLAREQDTEVKEENEELRKTVANLQKENKILASAATKLEAQNKQYVTTLETLQEKLESVNISNAKLLYISRALENASLNERQKERIVESISKAETIQEAKIIFDTLLETVTSSPAEKKVNSLSEAVSRRSTLLVGAREEQKKGNANPAFERLQRLAGITK